MNDLPSLLQLIADLREQASLDALTITKLREELERVTAERDKAWSDLSKEGY